MLIYLDMCCLKRPFDDQTQSRIRLESEAVLSLLAAESDDLRIMRSPALVLENNQNPVRERAAKVGSWLGAWPVTELDVRQLTERTAELMALGFKNFDALHIATAELGKAEVFASCDDRLLKLALRCKDNLRLRVSSVIDLAREALT